MGRSVLVILIAMVLAVSTASGEELPAAVKIMDEPGTLMRAKLTSSQRVLEGLLRKDFEAVARGAREMKRISEAAEWPRARDSVYEHFGAEFRRQCNQLEDLATKENHQAASFIYLHMTTTCIHCHDYVRDSLRIAGPGHGSGVQLIPSQWPDKRPE